MTSIGIAQAKALADLMKAEDAYKATTEEIDICGVKAQVVILDHDDQREGEWQTVHVLGHVSGSVSIGTVPKED